MSMHDDGPMIRTAFQEMLPDPAQVGGLLLFQRYILANSGVNKSIVAILYQVFSPAEEVYVRLRNAFAKDAGKFIEFQTFVQRIVAKIAANGRVAADAHKIAQGTYIARQGSEHTLLVIADQVMDMVEMRP